MKSDEVLVLLESFPELFDDEDLLEELAADLEPLGEREVADDVASQVCALATDSRR